MSIPVQPSSSERPNPELRYVYYCSNCHRSQMLPVYSGEPVIDSCLTCDTFFVIPSQPVVPENVIEVDSKEEAEKRLKELKD